MVDRYAFMVARCVPDSEDYENQSAYVKYDDYAALEQRVKELEAELHRARTDSRYWDEFNTVSAHDTLRAENEELKKELVRLTEAYYHKTEELRAEVERLQARLKEQAEAYSELIAQLHRDVAERDGEIKRALGGVE
jgi:uncharacterized coiled-coil DUF342 family protein